MATKNPLNEILQRLNTIDDKLKTLPKLEKKVNQIQKDIELIKNCVSTENAAQYPSLKRTNNKAKGGQKSSFPIAASPLK